MKHVTHRILCMFLAVAMLVSIFATPVLAVAEPVADTSLVVSESGNAPTSDPETETESEVTTEPEVTPEPETTLVQVEDVTVEAVSAAQLAAAYAAGNTSYILSQSYWNSATKVAWTHIDNNGDTTNYSSTITSVVLGGYSLPYHNNPTGANCANSSVYLSNCYPNVNTSKAGVAELVIHPADGYYVSRVVVACCCTRNDLTPFQCGTWNANNAYDSSFHIEEDGTLVIDLDSESFGHSSKDDAYYIVIDTEPIPDTIYVQYWPGIMEDHESFSGADWVVNDDLEYVLGSDESHTVDTVDTDFQYVNLNGTWYQFAGWKLEYYSDYTSSSSSLYDVTLTNHLSYDTTAAPGSTINPFTHAKLIAQWEEVDEPIGSLRITKTWTGLDAENYPDLKFRIDYPDGTIL